MPPSSEPDVAVIGAGIVGLATALALAERHRRRVVVLEAEAQVASHQTGHNSGVIHAGLYYKPGSAKATDCRAGQELMYRFCEAEGVPVRRSGKVVIAVAPEELPRLAALEQRGLANGVPLRRLGPAEVLDLEPEVRAVAGLHSPETGVVSYPAVCAAIVQRLQTQGGVVHLDHRVTGIHRRGGRLTVETTRGQFSPRALVNCAGLQADRVALLAGWDPGLRILPFRGEYYTLRPARAHLVRGLIYPVPDPALPFLGVHLTRGIDGVVEAGPNAVLAFKREGYRWGDVSPRDMLGWAAFPGTWRLLRRHWRSGLEEMRRSLSRPRFLRSLQRLLPGLDDADIVPGGSGVRAQAVGRDGALIDDFRIVERAGEVHVLNAPSPGATASLAIGAHVAQLVERSDGLAG